MTKLPLDVGRALPLLEQQAGEGVPEAVWREMQRQLGVPQDLGEGASRLSRNQLWTGEWRRWPSVCHDDTNVATVRDPAATRNRHQAAV